MGGYGDTFLKELGQGREVGHLGLGARRVGRGLGRHLGPGLLLWLAGREPGAAQWRSRQGPGTAAWQEQANATTWNSLGSLRPTMLLHAPAGGAMHGDAAGAGSSRIPRQPQAGHLPARLRGKEIAVAGAHMAWRREAGAAPQHKLPRHKLAVILPGIPRKRGKTGVG